MHKNGLFIALCGFLLSLYAGNVYAAETEAASRITRVMVYPGLALITRQATLKLNSGQQRIIFADIVPEIDENSLRVSGQGSAEVKIMGAQVKKEFLKEVASEKVRQLQDQIQILEDEARQQENLKSVFMDEKNFLDSVRFFSHEQLPKELATKFPAAKDLDEMMKFLDIKLRDNFSLVTETEVKTREIRKKIDALRRELSVIAGSRQRMKRSITVELQVLKPGEFDLAVSYLAGQASWQPIYDARADFQKSLVELVSFGLIRQSSGEEWSQVALSLSTSNPTISGTMPEVAPWLLKPYQPPSRAWAESDRMSLAKSKAQYSSADLGGAGPQEISDEAAMAPQQAQYAAAAAQEKGISMVYALERKTDIQSDGAEHKVPISSQSLKADFEYSAYPRVSPFAYLRSRVTNAKDLQLLGGRVNIFLDGDYVGSSVIKTIGPAEEFDLYLGVDENVKVKREQVEKKVDETIIGNIPSPTRRTTFKYKISVENYKSRKVRVELFEAMPVPEDDRIKVKMGQVSLEPKMKDWKDKKGVWLWELELAAKEKKEIIYNYTVEHPREMQIEGL